MLLILIAQAIAATEADRSGPTVRAEAGAAHSEAYIQGTSYEGGGDTTGGGALEFALAAGWRTGGVVEIFAEAVDRELRPNYRVLAGQGIKDSVAIDSLSIGLALHSSKGVCGAVEIGPAVVHTLTHTFDGTHTSSIYGYRQVLIGPQLRFTLAKEWLLTPRFGLGLAAHLSIESDARTWLEYAETLAVRASFF